MRGTEAISFGRQTRIHMSIRNPNTLEVLKAYARAGALGACNEMPLEVVRSIMLANNRILAAAIIESGGELRISSISIHEILTTASHVVAVATEDDALTITLASKDEIFTKPEALAL
jgi:hypothetical protein